MPQDAEDLTAVGVGAGVLGPRLTLGEPERFRDQGPGLSPLGAAPGDLSPPGLSMFWVLSASFKSRGRFLGCRADCRLGRVPTQMVEPCTGSFTTGPRRLQPLSTDVTPDLPAWPFALVLPERRALGSCSHPTEPLPSEMLWSKSLSAPARDDSPFAVSVAGP